MIRRLNLSSNLSRDEATQRALKADVNISTTLDMQNVPRDNDECVFGMRSEVVSSVTRRLCLRRRSLGYLLW